MPLPTGATVVSVAQPLLLTRKDGAVLHAIAMTNDGLVMSYLVVGSALQQGPPTWLSQDDVVSASIGSITTHTK